MAEALGKKEDAAKYNKQFEAISRLFPEDLCETRWQDRERTADGLLHGSQLSTCSQTQQREAGRGASGGTDYRQTIIIYLWASLACLSCCRR